jgi:hypothetical protein
LLIPTLFAGVSWFSPCCSSDAAKTEQHEDDGSDNWHDDLLSLGVATTLKSLMYLPNRSLTFLLPVGSKLLEIGPQVRELLLVLDG